MAIQISLHMASYFCTKYFTDPLSDELSLVYSISYSVPPNINMFLGVKKCSLCYYFIFAFRSLHPCCAGKRVFEPKQFCYGLPILLPVSVDYAIREGRLYFEDIPDFIYLDYNFR